MTQRQTERKRAHNFIYSTQVPTPARRSPCLVERSQEQQRPQSVHKSKGQLLVDDDEVLYTATLFEDLQADKAVDEPLVAEKKVVKQSHAIHKELASLKSIQRLKKVDSRTPIVIP